MPRLEENSNDAPILLTAKESLGWHEELCQSAPFTEPPIKIDLQAALDQLGDAIWEASETDGLQKTALSKSAIYQFKVTLLHTKPGIWRSIQITNQHLGNLHLAIQAAFSWQNYHLHQFIIDGERFGPQVPEDFANNFEWKSESKIKLKDLIPKYGRHIWWVYEYDFGDNWQHLIQFEGFSEKQHGVTYPRCVGGQHMQPNRRLRRTMGLSQLIGSPK